MPPVVGDVDSVNFARSLVGFDPLHQSPHLPGYPVFVFLARLSPGALPSPLRLALPAIVLFVPALFLGYTALARFFPKRVALGSMAVFTLAPGIVTASSWPASDGVGLALAIISTSLVASLLHPRESSSRSVLLAAVLVGLLLGARLSYWPIVASVLIATFIFRRRHGLAVLAGVSAGAVATVIPLLVFASPSDLAGGLFAFGQGHFTDWGLGTTGSSSVERISTAAATLLSGAGIDGERLSLTGLLIALFAAGGFAIAMADKREVLLRRAVLLALPYLLWVVLGQNVEKTRHFVPIFFVLGLASVVGLSRVDRRGRVLLVFAGALFLETAQLAWVQGRSPAPAAEMVRVVRKTFPPDHLQLFAGEEARVFEYLAPEIRIWRTEDPEVLVREANRTASLGATVLITSGAPGFERLARDLVPLAIMSEPEALRGHDYRLTLFEYAPRRSTLAAR